jgi:hypothetical protein
MKQTVSWILVSLVGCAICSLVTYRIAHHHGYESGYKNGVVSAIKEVHFAQSLSSFGALQKLRAGDAPGATRAIEKTCFASAHIFFKDPHPSARDISDWGRSVGWDRVTDAPATKEFAAELVKYRATYRTNSADWDTMEQKLAVELTKVSDSAAP